MSKYLITGGGFHNNGAESMLFTLVSELKEREPDCEIYVALNKIDFYITKNNYNFKFILKFTKQKQYTMNLLYRITHFYKKNYDELEKLMPDIDAIFDISGFALSSQWGVTASRNFLDTIRLAKKFNSKVILMPQSFGPFDYKKNKKKIMNEIKNTLSEADLIFCREKEGYDLMKELGLKNIELSTDMVLQRGKEYSNITKNDIAFDVPEIKENSALILPNERVYERMDHSTFMNIYNEIISHLLVKNMNVYISHYADDDVMLSKQIADNFINNNVYLLDKKYDCLEYEKIIPQFKFVISSRFHSVVHSYKNYVPCLVIGWAVKYKELCHSVNQDNFMFDCRENVNIHEVKNMLDVLIAQHGYQSLLIKEAVANIQQNSCFNKIWEVLENEKK